jgi:hypothetical protein
VGESSLERDLPEAPLPTLRPRSRRAALALLALALTPVRAPAGTFTTSATTESPTTVRIAWTWTDDPLAPIANPEWAGYDVFRRTTHGCETPIRLNITILPRTSGPSQSASWLDAPPLHAASYRYEVHPVTASRTAVSLSPCAAPCGPPAYAMAPALSSYVVNGLVRDLGSAVSVSECDTGCLDAVVVDDPAAQALRPYAGTDQLVQVWGTTDCDTPEGCVLALDHFVLSGTCGVTAARQATWGSLKSRYR